MFKKAKKAAGKIASCLCCCGLFSSSCCRKKRSGYYKIGDDTYEVSGNVPKIVEPGVSVNRRTPEK